jgi:hypothetical protein
MLVGLWTILCGILYLYIVFAPLPKKKKPEWKPEWPPENYHQMTLKEQMQSLADYNYKKGWGPKKII